MKLEIFVNLVLNFKFLVKTNGSYTFYKYHFYLSFEKAFL